MTTVFVMRRPGFKGPIVADGAVFPDGRTVLAWRGEHASVAVYPTPEACHLVHHHEDTWMRSVPEGWEMSMDPWHAEAFEGTPGEGVVGSGGKRQAAWLALDGWGNAVGTAGPVTAVAGAASSPAPEATSTIEVAVTDSVEAKDKVCPGCAHWRPVDGTGRECEKDHSAPLTVCSDFHAKPHDTINVDVWALERKDKV